MYNMRLCGTKHGSFDYRFDILMKLNRTRMNRTGYSLHIKDFVWNIGF